MSRRFDLGKNLKDGVRRVISKYIRAAKDNVSTEWQKMNTIDGEAHISSTQKPQQTNDVVSYIVEAWGQKAWIAEYGKGSLMDKSSENPYLSDYLASSNFNKNRLADGLAIMGRPKGVYKDLDGNVYTSSGSAEWVNLEDWWSSRHINLRGRNHRLKIDGYFYTPSPAYHVLKKALLDSNLLSDMEEEIHNVFIECVARYFKSEIKKVRISL